MSDAPPFPPAASAGTAPGRRNPGETLARGACRFLIDRGFAPVVEFAPAKGLRCDVLALGPKGEVWAVECKSGLPDFRADAKWEGYLDWCDRLFFAVGADFPAEVLPEDQGLMIADSFGAEILRMPAARRLAPARRKALSLRFARGAALRLRGALDPGAAAFAPGAPAPGQGPALPAVEAWASPPAYTGAEMVYLTEREGETIALPAGSRLQLRVYDAHYAGGAAMAALLHAGPVWRISSAPPPEGAEALRLPGRWPGERTMYLMALEPPHAE